MVIHPKFVPCPTADDMRRSIENGRETVEHAERTSVRVERQIRRTEFVLWNIRVSERFRVR